jgi:hypothetical protein
VDDRMRRSAVAQPRIGEARTAEAWTADDDARLMDWMSRANLEDRSAAFGLIDPGVLAELRGSSAA